MYKNSCKSQRSVLKFSLIFYSPLEGYQYPQGGTITHFEKDCYRVSFININYVKLVKLFLSCDKVGNVMV